MARFYLIRFGLHALFLVLSIVATFSALAAGPPCFVIVYGGLVLVELLARERFRPDFRHFFRFLATWILEFGFGILSALLAIGLVVYASPNLVKGPEPSYLSFGFPLVFLFFDTLFGGILYFFWRPIRAEPILDR